MVALSFPVLALGFGLAASPGAIPDATPVEFMQPVNRTVIYPDQTEVVMLSGVTLPLDVKEVFDRDFAPYPFFGAFAISKDFGYGYSTGTHTLLAAREMALANCLSMNAQCRIIAELVPVGYRGAEDGVITLSPEAAEYFERRNTYGRFRAMAVSAAGAYALVWNETSQSVADASALEDCEGYRGEEVEGLRDMPCILIPDF